LGVDEVGIQGDFYDAADGYFRALEQAGVTEGRRDRVNEAYGHYAAVMQEAWEAPELRERAFTAYAAYADAMSEAWDANGSRSRATQAYSTYVDAICDGWKTVEPDTLNPESLATIAQSMLSVATTAGLCSQGPEPEGE
jgi:hypothetical protein